MKQYNQHFSFKGLQTDLAESLASSEYMTDAFNVRLTTRKDNTAFIITNERGARKTSVSVEGDYVGHCLIKNWLVVFTKEGDDNLINRIYKIDLSNLNNAAIELYEDDLNITKDVKCIPYYESEDIMKVYWTDGINFPRVINIAVADPYYIGKPSSIFDFWPEMKLEEKVSIKKEFIAKAEFNSGVIQYIFTYYNKYTVETKPFYVSPLLYISPNDRGGKADEKINCAFTITIEGIDSNFDGIKIYSLQRTSLDGTPIARLITEKFINKSENSEESPKFTFTDSGVTGETIDVDYLLMKSSAEMFKAKTFTQKDNVLFFGNITLNERVTDVDINFDDTKLVCDYRPIYTKDKSLHGVNIVNNPYESNTPFYKLTYAYSNQLTAFSDLNFKDDTENEIDLEESFQHSVPCAGFKHGNTYRLGLQFQDKCGNWTDPIFLKDIQQENYPRCKNVDAVNDGVYEYIELPTFKYTLEITDNIAEYKKVRPLMVIPKESDRDIICQGVLNPTMYIQEDKDKTQYSSWFFRPWPNTTDIQYPFSCCPRFPNELDVKIPYGYHFWFFNKDININNLQAVAPCFSDWLDYPLYDVGQSSALTSSPNSYIGDKDDGLTWNTAVDSSSLDQNIKNILEDLSKGRITKEGYGGVLRRTEIQGEHHDNHKFRINDGSDGSGGFSTISSPDVEFSIDDYLNKTLDNNTISLVGNAEFRMTASYIHLDTSNDNIGNVNGKPFMNGEFCFVSPGPYGIISGAFYSAYILDDRDSGHEYYHNLYNPLWWLVYLWQMEGTSIINDPDETRCKLDEKRISNLRYSVTNYFDNEKNNIQTQAWVFSDEDIVIKDNIIYQGNVNVAQLPDGKYSKFFLRAGICSNYNVSQFTLIGNRRYLANNDYPYYGYDNLKPRVRSAFAFKWLNLVEMYNVDTDPNKSDAWWKTFQYTGNGSIFKWYDFTGGWNNQQTYDAKDDYNNSFLRGRGNSHDKYDIGDEEDNDHILFFDSGTVRIKYKSTPHLVIDKSIMGIWGDNRPTDGTKNSDTLWDKWYLPIVELKQNVINRYGGESPYAKRNNEWIPCGEPVSIGEVGSDPIDIEFSYGDTYYQRWDCLKTYPSDSTDRNQLVEIGSFMLETYTNIDGRTDRNRSQKDNTAMSPINFNLMNPVYSQMDNIFTYRILDEDVEKNLDFPCQITWTLEKEPTATVDTWTNVTLATNYQVDGTKGAINELRTWRDNIIIFQDRSLSQLLYNERVQIQASDNVPIEIANSGKVQGARAISENVGCNNRKLITQTSAGLYFIDSVNNHLYYYGEGLKDLSNTLAMTKWFDTNYDNFERLYLDDVNHDVYLSVLDDKIEEGKKSLRYSELLGQFTSFIGFKVPFMESHNDQIFALQNGCLYDMFKGNYNKFFPTESEEQSEENINWYIEFISNGKDQSMQDSDKMFSTIDYRADVFGCNLNSGEYTDYLPDEQLTTLEVTNEYQTTGEVELKRFINNTNHYKDTNLQKKFRIWRIQIPRNKNQEQGRIKDRIRNPWARFKLQCNNGFKTKLHDLNVQYFV